MKVFVRSSFLNQDIHHYITMVNLLKRTLVLVFSLRICRFVSYIPVCWRQIIGVNVFVNIICIINIIYHRLVLLHLSFMDIIDNILISHDNNPHQM